MLAEQRLAFCENFRDVRTQLASLRIDNLKHFFNAEGELLERTRDGLHLSALRGAVQEALEMDKEQQRRHGYQRGKEERVGFPVERIVFGNCFCPQRTGLERFSAVRTGCYISEAQTVTA